MSVSGLNLGGPDGPDLRPGSGQVLRFSPCVQVKQDELELSLERGVCVCLSVCACVVLVGVGDGVN